MQDIKNSVERHESDLTTEWGGRPHEIAATFKIHLLSIDKTINTKRTIINLRYKMKDFLHVASIIFS